MALLPLSLAVVAISGCGGESEPATDASTTADAEASAPEPAEPIADRIPAMEQAIESGDCADALEILHPQLLDDPEGGASKANCRNAAFYIEQLADFRAGESEEIGTAAVIDATGNDQSSLIWALDEDGSFKWTGSFFQSRQAGTEAPAELDFEENALALVAALREDDCKAAYKAITPDSRLDVGSEKEFCDQYEETFTATPEGLGSRLQADPEAEPVLLGTTHDGAYFALATSPSGYRTIIVSGTQSSLGVSDLVRAES